MHRVVSKAVTTVPSRLITIPPVFSVSLHRAPPACTAWTRIDPHRLGSGHPVGTSKAPARQISRILAGWLVAAVVGQRVHSECAWGAFRLLMGGAR